MNFYKRHLGAIAKNLGHLSQAEIGAYDLLMDWCYANERALPLRMADVYRIGRASTKSERSNVDRVLADFFIKTEDGYTQQRIVEELEAYAKRCETNRELGKLGGRPKVSRGGTESKTESVSESETETVRFTKPSENPNSEVRIQIPTERPKHAVVPTAPSPAGRACLAMRAAGCRVTNPSHPDLLAALDEGVTAEALAATVAEGIQAGKAKPFAWAIATARGRNAAGPTELATGPPRNGQAPAPSRRMTAIQTLLQGTSDGRHELAERRDPEGPEQAGLPVPRLGAIG